ncbi:MAG: hypothetical protein E7359_02915 [Clostridiales bacterium]|nr:hypothetical protein [Clostridiales bacterium]
MKKFLGIIVALVLVVGLGIGIYFLVSPNQEASAVMTLETNPEIQLVLDQNNKVMSVNAINEDGEKLMLSVNFVGLSANDAAEKFAEATTKFVTDKNSSNSTFLNEVNGELNVNVTIACEDATNEKYTKLKESVTNSVNNYYKEAKIMAGAIVNVTEDIKNEIEKLGYTASDYANKTYAEIMQDVKSKSEELKNVAFSKRDEVFSNLEALKTEFSEMFNLEETIKTQKALIQTEKDKIADYKEDLKTANEFQKVTLNALLDTAEAALKQYEKALDNFVKQYNTFKKEYQSDVNAFVKQLQNESKTVLNNIETTVKTAMQEAKTIVDNFTKEMESKGQSLITSIEQYQASLNA